MSIRYAVCLIYKICQKLISRILSVSCVLKYKNTLLTVIQSVYFPNFGSHKKKEGEGAATGRPHRPPGYVTVVLSQLYRVHNVTPRVSAP